MRQAGKETLGFLSFVLRRQAGSSPGELLQGLLWMTRSQLCVAECQQLRSWIRK